MICGSLVLFISCNVPSLFLSALWQTKWRKFTETLNFVQPVSTSLKERAYKSCSPLDLYTDRSRCKDSQNAGRTAVLSIQNPDPRTPGYLVELYKKFPAFCCMAITWFFTLWCVSLTAGWLLFQKAIHQPKYSDNISYLRIYTWLRGCETEKVNEWIASTGTGGEGAWVNPGQTGKIIRSVITETDHTVQFISSSDRWNGAEPCHSVSAFSSIVFIPASPKQWTQRVVPLSYHLMKWYKGTLDCSIMQPDASVSNYRKENVTLN